MKLRSSQKKMCLLAFLTTSIVTANALSPLPNPEPFAEIGSTERVAPELKMTTTVLRGTPFDYPVFTAANKEVAIGKSGTLIRVDQQHVISINIDGVKCGHIMFWGSLPDNAGFPFKEDKKNLPKLIVDEKAQKVTFLKKYKNAAGKDANFKYILEKNSDGNLDLSWESDDIVSLWWGVSDTIKPDSDVKTVYRGQKISIGDKEVKQYSDEELLTKRQSSVPYQGSICFRSDEPTLGYSISGELLAGSVAETGRHSDTSGVSWFDLTYRTKSAKKGKITIDLGESGVTLKKDAPAAINGLDMWKNDGIHVPVSPVRNIMPNPSFERDLSFWRWRGGGAMYNHKEAQNRYDIVDGGLFGQKALMIRNTNNIASGMTSFPMPLEKGAKYTLSCYIKTLNSSGKAQASLSIANAVGGGSLQGTFGTVFGDNSPESRFTVTKEWKRYSRTFTADEFGLCVFLEGINCMFDGLQLEKGATATDFITPPIEGRLITSNPDNALYISDKWDGKYRFTGQPKTVADAKLQIINAYKEVVYSKEIKVNIPESGTLSIPLDTDLDKLGRGVFVIRVDYKSANIPEYTQYERFSVIKPLANLHATKNFFGGLTHSTRVSRGEDLMRKTMEWGWGSTTSMQVNPKNREVFLYLYRKYRFSNRISATYDLALSRLFPEIKSWGDRVRKYRTLTSFSPEVLALTEKSCFEYLSYVELDDMPFVAFGNEEESSPMITSGNFDEYFKIQKAFVAGAKKANPNFKVTPTHGTSGYSKLRGFEPYEGYLKAAQKAGFKFDAIAIHPYNNIDKGVLGTNDADSEMQRLIEQMQRYGYGKETPIIISECFNVPEAYIPEWGATDNYDVYSKGKLSYDFGNREFIHAASLARMYIIYLKYWPQIDSVNCWMSQPSMDLHMTPILACLAVNTLANFMPDVAFYADAKPIAGVRGYVFKLKDGTAIAPLWMVDLDVEKGTKRASSINVKFSEDVEIYDFMGNRRAYPTDKAGISQLQLTSAPLYIKAKSAESLATSLQEATSNDAASCIQILFAPNLKGETVATLKNLTGREQKGILEIGSKKFPYSLSAEKEQTLIVDNSTQHSSGKLYSKSFNYTIIPEQGEKSQGSWEMDYFYVPKVKTTPNWSKIATLPFPSWHGTQPKNSADLSATYQVAWSEDNLYLRVNVKDSQILDIASTSKPDFFKHLYWADSCLEVYFDCGANGRSNTLNNYDNDDYRYDFAPPANNKTGRGHVWRLIEVYHQLADGINMATKDEASKKVICNYTRTKDGFVYEITFAQRYIEPIVLKSGYVAGLALYLHDKDKDANNKDVEKAITSSSKNNKHVQQNPKIWPLMLLAD